MSICGLSNVYLILDMHAEVKETISFDTFMVYTSVH